jgi:hypothetical protein
LSSPRRLLLVVAVAIGAAALGYGIGVATAADPRLDEADAALQKADALLADSQSGGVSDQAHTGSTRPLVAQSTTWPMRG